MATRESLDDYNKSRRKRIYRDIIERLGDGDEVHRDFYTTDVTFLLSELVKAKRIIEKATGETIEDL